MNKHLLKTKEANDYLTSFERFSHKILTVLYKSIFWFLIPFVILIFIVDGFNISVLFFLGLIYVIYVPIYKQNEKRLIVLIEMRKDEQKEEQLDEEALNEDEKDAFTVPAITVNWGANSLLVTFSSMFATFLLVWIYGWGSAITKSFIALSILLLAFSIWLPYSNLVKRQVKIMKEAIKVGKRTISHKELRKIVCAANGSTVEFHFTYTNEDLEIKVENEYQIETKNYLEKWCEQVGIPFSEKK